MAAITGFEDGIAAVNGQQIAFSRAGNGPPALLLHGFPQTRAMWHGIAPDLAKDYTVIAADLRGYGDSSKPDRVEDMSFRKMATDMVSLMDHLGFDRFHLVGHDRGARVAHRLALDHEAPLSLTMMDIIPTQHLLAELSHQVAQAYYHWFFLAQPGPFPETMIGHDPDHYYQTCLTGWDSATLDGWDQDALAQYRQSWRRPETIAAMCHDYRAAIEIDIIDDAHDLLRRVTVPALVLYGEAGVMAREYDFTEVWGERLSDLQVQPIPGGHFFPDLHPGKTLQALKAFLSGL
ncbi:MAG: alpha/beta hydrolase [Rhodobacteraceae bacterium]|nr:alpha/beta hydrolase [Paracoccaceae bacterium]